MAADKLLWLPFYHKDWLSDRLVRSMDFMERGAYIDLLCYAWDGSPIGYLHSTTEGVRKLLNLSAEDWEAHREAIMAPFTVCDGGWYQKRMVDEGKKSKAIFHSHSERGKKGAKARYSKNGSPAIAQVCLKHSSANGSAIAQLDHSYAQSQSHIHIQEEEKRRQVSLRDFSLESSEPEKKKKPANCRQPESFAEFTTYCRSKGMNDNDIMGLYSGWEANGWTRNGRPIKKWKAAVVNWKINGFLASQKRERR